MCPPIGTPSVLASCGSTVLARWAMALSMMAWWGCPYTSTLMPGSTIGGKEYRFADKKGFKKPEDLNPLPESFLELLMKDTITVGTKTTVNVKDTTVTMLTTNIESVRRYIRRIFAVSGQGGHNAAYRAACRLADAGLGEAEVFAELIEWNQTNAIPQFDLKALEHKARDATNRKRG